MDFQPWFVGRRAEPAVSALDFAGAATATPSPDVLSALQDPGLDAVVICPSNPFISIGPMLAMPWFRAALESCRAPVIAVSPIIAGQAVKGPTARMLAGFGMPVTAEAVARHYGSLISGYVLDDADSAAAASLAPLEVRATRTLMVSLADRIALARAVLALAREIGRR